MKMAQFVEDDAGQLSCMRLLTCAVVLTVLGMWVWANLTSGTYVPLGVGEVGLISVSLGSKAVQGHFEYGH